MSWNRASWPLTLLIAVTLDAQETPPSAKALFLADASVGTDVTVQTKQSKPAPPGQVQRRQPGPGGTSPQVKREGDYAGLSYWVELRTAEGQQLWVNSSRVFHSGDRIRLHLTSRIDGEMTILQSQNGTSFAKLYPTRTTPSARIEKAKEVTLPWFRFDNQPGDIRLLVAINARAANTTASSATASSAAPPATRMSPEEERRLFESLQAQVDRQKGSKALLVEEDESPEKPATYVVAPAAAGGDANMLVTEIRLAHR